MSERRGQSQGGGGGLPAAPQPVPGLPENAAFYELNDFRTLNRQVSRAAIGDEDMAWCHNLLPIASHYLRSTPDNGAAVYDAANSHPGRTITFFGFWTDKDDTLFSLIFFDDGSAQQLEVDTGAVIFVAGPGTFGTLLNNPPVAMIQAGLAGGVVVLIVSPQAGAADPNGYFIWDGANLFKAGTVSPVAVITDGGKNYTSAPGVAVFGGSGSGSAVVATVEQGSVSEIMVLAPGMGYLPTDTAILLFTGGGQGTSAVGIGNTADGVITSLTLVSGGSGFSSVPGISFTPIGGGAGASAVVTGISGGIITSVQMISGGSGYTNGAIVSTVGGGGSGAIFEPVIEDGVVVSVTMLGFGSGYSKPPDVVYHSTSGSGATGVAVLSGGQVTGVRFDFPSQGGSNYQTPPIVQFVGGGGPASGEITLMPFGISGDDIESYNGRVWIPNRNRFFFSAPESLVDFGNGGGAFQDTDPFLRTIYKRFKQSNGFLFLIGDSSVNYISGVTTGPASSTDVTPITKFSNFNIDPQIGCNFPATVNVFSREILFGNFNGVFGITGGTVQKKSMAIDELFYQPQIDYTVLGEYLPSSAVTSLFSTDTLVYLTSVFNPFTQTFQPMFLMWNGRRWSTADQTADIRWINGAEKDSKTQAYGTDGTRIFPLLVNQASQLERILQSKLWLRPSIVLEKRAWAIYALFECYAGTVLDFTIDTETGAFAVTQGTFAGGGSQQQPGIKWARSAAPAAAGMTIGFTMTSVSADFALLTALLVGQDYASRT